VRTDGSGDLLPGEEALPAPLHRRQFHSGAVAFLPFAQPSLRFSLPSAHMQGIDLRFVVLESLVAIPLTHRRSGTEETSMTSRE
jgi:hypothetical protein